MKMYTDKEFKNKFGLEGLTRKILKSLKSDYKRFEHVFKLKEIKQDKDMFTLPWFRDGKFVK